MTEAWVLSHSALIGPRKPYTLRHNAATKQTKHNDFVYF